MTLEDIIKELKEMEDLSKSGVVAIDFNTVKEIIPFLEILSRHSNER